MKAFLSVILIYIKIQIVRMFNNPSAYRLNNK
uniref:Uncharacterized protein n=1 Tax=Cryptosporidium parvum TaxID=5807 RepID=F0X596_CRYPV